ncbi:MAG: PDGLE domain-containing protein [Ornithinimicrobium sp.]|uniref:PDGLE domain-containing protein n=1 Tax=Ornithinimicrobium sp. TaxID=1977084 RepID=UPI0026E0E110|nr:PDGLE domain-containing protein [Ornithinimicrobium sp.]MDO5739694.1 PDGLE domain-containing protein [Ornithinimicrobium sp.]
MTPTGEPEWRVRTRTLVGLGLLLSLAIAVGLSIFASSHPDGLEHVAGSLGFIDAARDSATADSPLADYNVRGVDGPLSGSLAGAIGVLVTGAIAYLLFRLLRHKH